MLEKQTDYVEDEIPSESLKELSRQVDALMNNHPPKLVLTWDNTNYSVSTYIEVSKQQTHRHNTPVIILPKGEPRFNQLAINHYCRFNAKIIAAFSTAKEPLELFKAFKPTKSDRPVSITFIAEPALNRNDYVYDQFLSYTISKFMYLAAVDSEQLVVLSDDVINPGEEVYVTGLVFQATKLKEKLNLGQKQYLCLATKMEPIGREYDLTPQLFEKCRNKPIEWFQKSVMYPFHHTTSDYATLATLEIFHVHTSFPFNIMFVGPAGTGKSAFMKKVSAITGEPLHNTSGSSSLKGLLPSFYAQQKDAGALASAKYRVLVDEFFEFMNKIQSPYRGSVFSLMKDILEGSEVNYVSGTGSMRIQMKADLIGCTNPPRKEGKGGYYESVIELYDYFDPPIMDRFLFYWVPESQLQIVEDYKSEVKSKHQDTLEGLKNIDYDAEGILNLQELKRILNFLKICRHEINPALLDKYARELVKELPANIFSRKHEFLINIATSYAVIRELSEGTLNNESQVVNVTDDDLFLAKAFLKHIIKDNYAQTEKFAGSRERAIRALTPVEVTAFQLLTTQYASAGEKYARKLSFEHLLQDAQVPAADLQEALNSLEAKHLIIQNSTEAMLIPELSEASAHVLMKIRTKVLLEQEEKKLGNFLCKTGLVSWSENEGYFSLWEKEGQKVLSVSEVSTPLKEAVAPLPVAPAPKTPADNIVIKQEIPQKPQIEQPVAQPEQAALPEPNFLPTADSPKDLETTLRAYAAQTQGRSRTIVEELPSRGDLNQWGFSNQTIDAAIDARLIHCPIEDRFRTVLA